MSLLKTRNPAVRKMICEIEKTARTTDAARAYHVSVLAPALKKAKVSPELFVQVSLENRGIEVDGIDGMFEEIEAVKQKRSSLSRGKRDELLETGETYRFLKEAYDALPEPASETSETPEAPAPVGVSENNNTEDHEGD